MVSGLDLTILFSFIIGGAVLSVAASCFIAMVGRSGSRRPRRDSEHLIGHGRREREPGGPRHEVGGHRRAA
ncbi:MAG TPA: hypothetical protein VFV01_41340 [Spirillospora sp.]|nr:hypothetical protein [Spirillospora sp.]